MIPHPEVRCKTASNKTLNLLFLIFMNFTFTEQQSSCISSVNLEDQEVTISFQSNPEKSYSFVTENEDEIVDFLQNPGDASIGKMYRTWIAERMLIPADQLAAV